MEMRMQTEAYIALAIFLTLGIHFLASKWIGQKLNVINQAIFYQNLIWDHIERLDRWERVRPFIYRGYCGYARRLILEMIEAYEFLLEKGFAKDREILFSLRRLLFEFPPDYDPPQTGGSFYVINKKPFKMNDFVCAVRRIETYSFSTPIGWIVSQAHNPAQSGFDSSQNMLSACFFTLHSNNRKAVPGGTTFHVGCAPYSTMFERRWL
jgi:hypothetical protein